MSLSRSFASLEDDTERERYCMPIEVVRRMRSCANESNILLVFFILSCLPKKVLQRMHSGRQATPEEKRQREPQEGTCLICTKRLSLPRGGRFSPSPRPHSLKTAEISTADLGLSALSFQHLVKFVCFFDCSNIGFLLAKILAPTPWGRGR